ARRRGSRRRAPPSRRRADANHPSDGPAKSGSSPLQPGIGAVATGAEPRPTGSGPKKKRHALEKKRHSRIRTGEFRPGGVSPHPPRALGAAHPAYQNLRVAGAGLPDEDDDGMAASIGPSEDEPHDTDAALETEDEIEAEAVAEVG